MIKHAYMDELSFDDIEKNIDQYFSLFLKYGLVCFRRSFFDIFEQRKITELFSKKLNCNYISSQNNEDHSFTFDKNIKLMSKNEIFIPWHLEHLQKEHPQVAASWNMLSFECETGAGNTGFVSAIDLYNEMPVEWKSFLELCDVMTEGKYILPRKCIQNHRIKDEKIIRLSPNYPIYEDFLYSVNKEHPSKKDIKLFNEIVAWYKEQVEDNVNIQNWWEWSNGDLLIVDLSYMIHAVKGGFTPGQRIFSRYWIFVNETDDTLG